MCAQAISASISSTTQSSASSRLQPCRASTSASLSPDPSSALGLAGCGCHLQQLLLLPRQARPWLIELVCSSRRCPIPTNFTISRSSTIGGAARTTPVPCRGVATVQQMGGTLRLQRISLHTLTATFRIPPPRPSAHDHTRWRRRVPSSW